MKSGSRRCQASTESREGSGGSRIGSGQANRRYPILILIKACTQAESYNVLHSQVLSVGMDYAQLYTIVGKALHSTMYSVELCYCCARAVRTIHSMTQKRRHSFR